MSEKLLRFSSNDLNLVEIFFNSQRYLNWQSLRSELSLRFVNMSINPSLAVFIDLLLASPYYLLWAGSVAEFRAANNCISVGVLAVEAFSI